VRKIRWKRLGMGKRGGVRLIYFIRCDPNEIWMLNIYARRAAPKTNPSMINSKSSWQR
jgi:hypothetical protein